jgi:TetR/AcrR family transcriptional repressor of nem operon
MTALFVKVELMRDPENTRQSILDVSADEIHKHGFNATSLSVILNRCEISKGALYHHFANKLELGYAVFEEVYTPMFLGTWQPALMVDDPIEGLCDFFTNMHQCMSQEEISCGCPLNNLCQEMSCVDEGFRLRILNMEQQLNKMFVDSFEKISHLLRNDIDYSQVSYFIVAAMHGSTSLSRSASDKKVFAMVLAELCNYIRALKK